MSCAINREHLLQWDGCWICQRCGERFTGASKLDIADKALAAVTQHLDELVGACIDKNDGKPAMPSYRALMSARGALPPTAVHAFPAKEPK